MIPKVRNLQVIRNGQAQGYHYAEAFEDLMAAFHNVTQQTNSNPNGPVDAPPQISAVNVVASGGVHDVTIQDDAPVNRGAHYFLDWDTDPQFKNARTISLGPTRQWRGTLGINGNVYFRGYHSYPTSAPSEAVYAGTQSNPTGFNAGSITLPVSGGNATGAITGPTPLPTTGSGTEPSVQPQGAAGFGFNPQRGAKGNLL